MRQINPIYCHFLLLYYPFSILFLYFILQVKPRLETSQGVPLPHQTVGNAKNGNPLRLASSRSKKGGYGKNIGRRSYNSQYRGFLSFIFRPFASDEDATYLSPTDPPWCRLPTHGAVAAAPPSPTPTRSCHCWNEHLGWMGFWSGIGHPGGGTQGFWSDAADRDEGSVGGVLTY